MQTDDREWSSFYSGHAIHLREKVGNRHAVDEATAVPASDAAMLGSSRSSAVAAPVNIDIRIRPYRFSDCHAIHEAVRESFADMHPWMPWCHDRYSIADTRAWLTVQLPAFRDGKAFEFAILSSDDCYLGGCGLNQVDLENGRANLGYWVRSAATRHGVATAAAGLLRDWAFAHTSFIRLEILIATGNQASLRVAEKLGATREGTLRRRLLLHGTAHDAIMFSVTRPPIAAESGRPAQSV